MPEFAFNIATKEHDCPRCGRTKGEVCRTPAGRKARTPHGERVHQLSKSDWGRCVGRSYSAAEALGASGQPAGIQSGEGPR